MNTYEAAGEPVAPFRYPTTYDPTNEPSAPMLLISAIAPPATFFGSNSGTIAKNGPYGAYIAAPAITSNAYETQKCVEPSRYDPAERHRADQQERPHEQLAAIAACPMPTKPQHRDGRRKIRHRREPARLAPCRTSTPLLRIDGSHSTKPYTPMLQQKYCAHSLITAGERNASP